MNIRRATEVISRIFRADDRPLAVVARNVSSRYAAILADTAIGLVMLPFNVAHLGPSAYGLWMLTASLTVHFSVLDLGFGGALVRFVAYYRTRGRPRALNEIASTMFVVFAAVGCLAYAAAAGIAFNLDALFTLTPEQAAVGRWLLLVIGVHVALSFPFSVYGGIVSGFQRYDVNGVVAVVTSLVVALVNVAVLRAGYGLVTLVAAITAVRIAAYFVYRANAYRIFPALRISPFLFRRGRLREVTGFSVYNAVIEWAHKLNFQVDQLVIGAFLGAAPVAVWAVAERIIHATHRLTNQFSTVIFPMIVDSYATLRQDRLQKILLEGTRLSLMMVVPVATMLALFAEPLVRAWVRRPELLQSVPVIQILAVAVAVRVGASTATTLLKGCGSHRMLAGVNLATACANVALSIALVRRFGLVGVAVGTLVPVAASLMLVLFPAACRQAGLPLGRAVWHGVLPPVWPAAIVAALIVSLPVAAAPATLWGVAALSAAGLAIYLALFFFVAIGRADRALYTRRLRQLVAEDGRSDPQDKSRRAA